MLVDASSNLARPVAPLRAVLAYAEQITYRYD